MSSGMPFMHATEGSQNKTRHLEIYPACMQVSSRQGLRAAFCAIPSTNLGRSYKFSFEDLMSQLLPNLVRFTKHTTSRWSEDETVRRWRLMPGLCLKYRCNGMAAKISCKPSINTCKPFRTPYHLLNKVTAQRSLDRDAFAGELSA